MRSIKDVELKNKRVLMRVDFNVPMDKNGSIIDDARIKAAVPTIDYIIKNGASLILMSHLGRPKGKKDEKYSLKEIAVYLGQLINKKVVMAEDCIGEEVKRQANELLAGEILMLENVRFYPGEEKNDAEFSRELAVLGDIYVNDAFGTAHRAHSSTAGVADYLPAYAGFLLENEVKMLRKVLDHPESPRMAILGGAKVKDKLGLIRNLLDKMDILLIGGGMANTFLKAQGKNIGKSICEDELIAEAQELLVLAREKKTEIFLPLDAVAADELSAEAKPLKLALEDMPDDKMILDIGAKTVELYKEAIAKAHTIIWNGPLGVYEYEQFAVGTEKVAHAVAASSAVSLIGGGDSAAAVHKLGLDKDITHISTGGGATLEFLEGIELPGVKSCEK